MFESYGLARLERSNEKMKHTSIDIYLVIDTFLLLLIGIGPKIALVPFLKVTGPLDDPTKKLIVGKMLRTAGKVAVLLYSRSPSRIC